VRSACQVSAGKPQGQKPVGKPRHRWEDNNEMDLRIHLMEERGQQQVLTNMVMNFWVP
jgi:hypothetical protein